MVGIAEMGAPISLDEVAVHPDCWRLCLCYVRFAWENLEDGKMYLLVPAHFIALCKMVGVCVCVCVVWQLCTFLLTRTLQLPITWIISRRFFYKLVDIYLADRLMMGMCPTTAKSDISHYSCTSVVIHGKYNYLLVDSITFLVWENVSKVPRYLKW